MPIDFSKPLPWTTHTTDADVAALLKDLQGNILKGHGRDFTVNLFFRFDSGTPGPRNFVHGMATVVTKALDQLTAAKAHRAATLKQATASNPFTSLFLSIFGYVALNVGDPLIPSDPAFRDGLKKRAGGLKDPDPNAWIAPFHQDVHAMVLIADTSRSNVQALEQKLRATLPAGVKVVGAIEGTAFRNRRHDGVEHFGYVDGRSQPLLLVEDVERERDRTDGISVWDPAFGIDQVLVDSPGSAGPLGKGSYFVFRQLEQNVQGFKDAEIALSKALGMTGSARKRAGAMVVGRFKDGTPVVVQSAEGMHNPVPNNFDFKDDPTGIKCPFAGHIRKSNPRGDSTRMGPQVTLEEERAHIMARRGITYGDRVLNDHGEFDEAELPTKDVGLLFMAYQRGFQNQFEFTQKVWVNNEGFVNPNTGIDPVIGQHNGPIIPQEYPPGWGQPGTLPFTFADFVTMKGGEYFFAPSISTLANI